MKSFNELTKSFDKIFPGIISFLKGLFFLIFWETPRDLYNTFLKHWKEAKSVSEKFSIFFAGLIIGSFLLYGFLGLYNEFNNWNTKEWREEVLFKDYEHEVKSFLNKYNERFSAHDCDFMRKVGADEAMYDKWGTTEYPKDSYPCEEFVNYQNKFLIPVFISPIKKVDEKYKVDGKMLIVRINQGEPWEIKTVYFNLWKKLDWELWHFNNPKNGPRTISTKLLQ